MSRNKEKKTQLKILLNQRARDQEALGFNECGDVLREPRYPNDPDYIRGWKMAVRHDNEE